MSWARYVVFLSGTGVIATTTKRIPSVTRFALSILQKFSPRAELNSTTALTNVYFVNFVVQINSSLRFQRLEVNVLLASLIYVEV